MKVTFELPNGDKSSIEVDIDNQIDDIEGVSYIAFGCSWEEYLADRIKEHADQCTSDIQSGRYDQAFQRDFEELYPKRPMEVHL